MNARDAYLTALIRARRDRSVEGVLRSGEAFRGLDDHVVAEHCLRIAAQLAAGDEQAQAGVQEARQRWAARPAAPEGREGSVVGVPVTDTPDWPAASR